MKTNNNLVVLTIFLALVVFPINAFAQQDNEMKFIDASQLMIMGKGFENSMGTYDRLPIELKSEFREKLQYLGHNSAGIAIRFSSNSTSISAKWVVTNNFVLSHMAMTGIKGLDLYVLDKGKWMFIGSARPTGKENSWGIIKWMDKSSKEFIAFLPLYDGVESLQIGVDKDSQIGLPNSNKLIKDSKNKPLVIYGTSITQGGCASRPGMAYTSILSRMLNREVVNLGFSGNAHMDFSISKALAMADASAYVLDCLPNTTTKSVKDSAYRFITNLLKAKPNVPIYMVENPNFANLIVDKATSNDLLQENIVWFELYKQLRKEGFNQMRYIKADDFFGSDNEGTVDGIHPTDLGMHRMAQKLYKELKGFKVN